jgi:type IV secretion system protein VirD4
VSELLGKETLDTNTYGKSMGRNGSYSTNYQMSGRELLTPDEVRMLDNRYALLFIRGERAVLDEKFDILRHPNVAATADGKAGAFKHGAVTESVATLAVDWSASPGALPESEYTGEYLLYSDEDLERLFNNNYNVEENKSNEEKPKRKPKQNRHAGKG